MSFLKNVFGGGAQDRASGGGTMDEDRFWQIIESNGGDAEKITAALSKLSPQEVDQWDEIYWCKHSALNSWDVWNAAYVINSGCSDDGFHYFKAWLIGKGRTAYEAALRSPDDLGPFVNEDDLEAMCDNELLNYASSEAYEKLTKSELPLRSQESDQVRGEMVDEDELPQHYPKLAKRFG